MHTFDSAPPTPPMPDPEAQEAHEILARDFTDRYLARQGPLKHFAYSAPYDPADPLCDYEKTWWEALPNRSSERAGKLILGKMHRMSGREIDDVFVTPFVEKADEITRVLPEYPVMLINGHHVDLQAALSLLANSLGVARASDGEYQQQLEEMIKISHGVVTRGTVPIVIGRPKLPVRVPFIRVQQLVVNPHTSFPINKQMRESGISEAFRGRYNSKLKTGSIEVAHSSTNHPDGFRTVWSMAPNGTPDFPGEGEHEGKLVTKAVEQASIRLMREMGCALIPVYTKLGKGKSPTVVELGGIIPPDEVTDSTIPTIMADLAEFRRSHGQDNVFYEEELAA